MKASRAALRRAEPEELIAMLMHAHGVENPEQLSGRSTVSLRTLKRWQAEGYPVWWEKSIDLMDELGLLRRGGASADPAELLVQLQEATAVLVDTTRQALADLEVLAERLVALEARLAPAPGRRPASGKRAAAAS